MGANRNRVAESAKGVRPNLGIGPEHMVLSLLKGRYCFENFMMEPICHEKGSLTEPAGTSLTEINLHTGRHRFEYTFLGDNTDAFRPTLASEGGYNWGASSDVVGTGFELNFGGLKDAHPRNFKPYVSGGGGEDWFARILLITDDASGVDIFFGFRKAAAYAATLTEYSDVTGLRIIGNSGSTDASYQIITNLNNAGATDYTATTPIPAIAGLEDATAVELEVRAIGGAAQWWINGIRYVGTTYSFDTGDVMCPVLRMTQQTDIAAQIKTLAFEAGPIEDRQPGTLLSLAGATS